MSGIELSSQAWEWINRGAAVAGIVTFIAWVAGLIVGIVNRDRIKRWLRTNRFPKVGGAPEHERSWRGIVFTVSRTDVPAWVVERCLPDYVAFVASRESKGAAEELMRHVERMGIKVLAPNVINDPDDPAEIRRATSYLLDELRAACDGGMLAVDITGGKVPMSIGAFMAAEEHKADTLYASADYVNGVPDPGTLRLITLSRPAD